MITSDRTDPETLEEYRLRAATERDDTRTRPPEPARLGSAVVGEWRCRNPQCPDGRPLIPVMDFAQGMLDTMNRELRKRGEKLISVDDVLVCPRCAPLLAAAYEAERARRTKEVASLVVEARNFKTSTRRREEIYERLKQLGEDSSGLASAINERTQRGNRSV